MTSQDYHEKPPQLIRYFMYNFKSWMRVLPRGKRGQPRKVVFLSVEGSRTEQDYFRLLNFHRKDLGFKSNVHIEVLGHDFDTNSGIGNVFDLLDDVLQIRKKGISENDLSDALKDQNEIPIERIRLFLTDKLSEKEKESVDDALRLLKIDYTYQKYLKDLNDGEIEKDDVYAMVIDRDKQSHRRDKLTEIINKCNENGFMCILTNPCFEFWLLLNLCDVKEEYAGRLELFSDNKRVSGKHTFTSKELSLKAGHYKGISDAVFRQYYLDGLETGMKNAEKFETSLDKIIDNLGTNMPKLINVLRE